LTTFVQIRCAYCGHSRKLPLFKTNDEEHMWCIKCHRTSKFNHGTQTAYKLEDIKIKLKGEHE